MAEKETQAAESYSIGERNGTYFTEVNGGQDPLPEAAPRATGTKPGIMGTSNNFRNPPEAT